MSTDERYNGWANRETWAVALHINNDQGWQESVHEALRAVPAYGGATEIPAWVAGNVIRSEVEDALDVETYGSVDDGAHCHNYVTQMLPVLRDIGSLWRVDWAELGAAFLADLAELDEH